MSAKTTMLKLRSRVWERQLPKIITLTDFEPMGVRFEAQSVSELHRIINRGYEADYLGRMLDALEPNDVLYDIGANLGLVALHAARRCRTAAFEPDPETAARLRRNVTLNPDSPPDVLSVAISDVDGPVTLFTDGIDGTSPSLVHQRDEKHTVRVVARRLDTLVERGELPMPTVLKLDIEGAEILALRGGMGVLHGPDAPRMLFLEVHDTFLPRFGSSSEEVREIARSAGYTAVVYEGERLDQQHLILARA